MKYVNPLTEEIKQTLKEMYLKHPKSRCRQRAHAIILSSEGLSIPKIIKVLPVRRNAVSEWIDHWEKDGLMGLYDAPRSGRPSIYDDGEIEAFKKLVDDEPRKIKSAHAKLQARTGKKSSHETAKRALKKSLAIAGNELGGR